MDSPKSQETPPEAKQGNFMRSEVEGKFDFMDSPIC